MKKFLVLSVFFVSSCSFLGIDGRANAQRDEELRKEIDGFETPSVEKALYESALTSLENNEYPKAEQFLKQLIKDHPDNPTYLQKYADLGRRMGKCKVSVGIYNSLLAKDAGNLDFQEGKALCQLQMGDYEKAGRTFTEIMEKDATRWRSINGAGLIFVSRKKYAEATQYFTLASEVSGEDPTILNNMALTKALVGNYTDAIEILKKASTSSKEVPEQKRRVDLNLALVYGISGDFDSAKATAAPHLTEPQLYNNLGIYSELAHQPELAKTYLNKALASTTIYYDRAWENLDRLDKNGR